MTSVSFGLPMVNVPVLSNAIVVICPGTLQATTALEQNAVAGGIRQRGEGGGRGGDNERAGRGDHQQGHRPVEAVAEIAIEHEPGNETDQSREENHPDRVFAFECVGEALNLLFCSRASSTNPMILESMLSCGEFGDSHLNRAAAIDGSGKNGVADMFHHRDRFAGDRGLIDIALSGDD